MLKNLNIYLIQLNFIFLNSLRLDTYSEKVTISVSFTINDA